MPRMIGLEPGKVPRPVVPPGKSTRTNESRVEPGSSIFGGLPASAIEALRNLLVVIGPVASSSTTIPKLVGTPRVAVTTIISDAGSAVLAEIIDLLVDNFADGSIFKPESAFVALLAEVEFPVAVFVPAAGAVPAG